MHPPSTLHETRRQWFAAALRGEAPAWTGLLGEVDEVLVDASTEGVAPLLHRESSTRQDRWQLPEALEQGLAEATRAEVVSTLLRESECLRILLCLAEARLPALLLKGSALAYWAYDLPYLRPCVDIDFLFVSYEAAMAASLALQALGYVPLSRALPGNLTTFEVGCVRVVADTQIWVDLHWGVGGGPVFADRLRVDELFAAAISLPKLAPTARGIGPVHAYLHNSTHRAMQLHLGTGDRLKWHYDLHRLACSFTANDWDRLVELCEQRSLAGACLDAMQASAALFKTGVPPTVVTRLTLAARGEKPDIRRMHSWKYVEYVNFRAQPTLRHRIRWFKQRLFPDRIYLDDMYGGRWSGYGRYLRKGIRKFFGFTS